MIFCCLGSALLFPAQPNTSQVQEHAEDEHAHSNRIIEDVLHVASLRLLHRLRSRGLQAEFPRFHNYVLVAPKHCCQSNDEKNQEKGDAQDQRVSHDVSFVSRRASVQPYRLCEAPPQSKVSASTMACLVRNASPYTGRPQLSGTGSWDASRTARCAHWQPQNRH